MTYICRKVDLDKRDEKIIDKMIMSALKKVIRDPIKVLKGLDGQASEEYIQGYENYLKFRGDYVLSYYDRY